jgi:uncharacterized protein YgbK (DUF1537 family)
VKEGDDLVPASETEFAKDRAFGYSFSDLKDYVEEKTGGRVKAADVASFSLADIRNGGPERVSAKLLSLPKVQTRSPCPFASTEAVSASTRT